MIRKHGWLYSHRVDIAEALKLKKASISATYGGGIAKGDYESSKHDYWQGALRRMSTRACEGRANRNRLCHHREITEENHDILYRLLMSIRYPMAME